MPPTSMTRDLDILLREIDGELPMSAESLKRRLIPLIKGGYRDDVRCEILIHLKDNPQDEEVWGWSVAIARTPEDRLRAVKQWVRFNPESAPARNMLARLQTVGGATAVLADPGANGKEGSLHHKLTPFSAREFILALFTGQRAILNEVALLIDEIKAGKNYSLLLRGPAGCGKSLLASLILSYIDPQRKNTLTIPGHAIYETDDLKRKRFLLIEEFDDIPAPEILVPMMDSGNHTIIFTSRGAAPLTETFAWRTKSFPFAEYSLMDLGDIAYKRLLKKNIVISNMFRYQIARYCQGSPRDAVSYAERLGLLWGKGEINDNLGELIYMLNYTLEYQPVEAGHNFLAIWDNQVMRAIGIDEIQARLRTLQFPFGQKNKVPSRTVQLLPVDERQAQVNRQDIALPPYIFQVTVNPAGPVSGTVNKSPPKGLVLGAHSERELVAFVTLCGFDLYDAKGAPESDHRPRLTIPEEVHLMVWERDDGCCVLCGAKEDLGFDHVIPLTRGGSSTARNLQILCDTCYQAKQTKYEADGK
jgi:hypothetical protein